jgi:hypothetical protein
MDMSRTDELQHRVLGISMILAPSLLLLSSVIGWSGSEQWAGVIQVYAMFLFIPTALGLTSLLWARVPRLAVALRMLLFFGCVGGIGYGLAVAIDAAMEGARVDQTALDELTDIVESGLPLVLNLPGITFPLSLVVTGFTLWRTRAVPTPPATLLVLAGVGFPISRIGGIEPLMIVVDATFVVALGWIGSTFLRSSAGSVPVPAVAKMA